MLGGPLVGFSGTAGSAAVQGDQAYGPYGNTRYQAGNMGTAKGFTGQYQDATGLDYYGARYYDPVVGRFLSVDRVQGNQQGMDPYAYVGGNPETNNDPSGECAPGEACLPNSGLSSSNSSSYGDPGPQVECALFHALYAFHLPGGGELGVPGIFCSWCAVADGNETEGFATNEDDAYASVRDRIDVAQLPGDPPDESSGAVAHDPDSNPTSQSTETTGGIARSLLTSGFSIRGDD